MSSLGDSSHEPVHCHGEEHWRQDASLFDTGVHSEWFCHLVIVYDSAFKVFVQGLDDVHQFLWDSMVPQNLLERWSVQAVKSLLKVHEHQVQRAVPFMSLFNDLAENKDVVDA